MIIVVDYMTQTNQYTVGCGSRVVLIMQLHWHGALEHMRDTKHICVHHKNNREVQCHSKPNQSACFTQLMFYLWILHRLENR